MEDNKHGAEECEVSGEFSPIADEPAGETPETEFPPLCAAQNEIVTESETEEAEATVEVEDEKRPDYFSPAWYAKHFIRDKMPAVASFFKKVGEFFKKIKITPTAFVAIAFLVVVTIIGYYILFPARGTLHSDTTDTILWASASLESKSAFNKDFCYACLLPFGGHLIMLPFVAIFGVTMTAQTLGMFTFFLIFTATLYLMLRKLDWSRAWSMLGVICTLLMISGSEKLREIFWEHIIYYSLGMLFSFIGLALVSATIDRLDKGREKRVQFAIFAALLFLWCFLTGLNQIESLVIFLVPAFGAFVAERYLSGVRSKTGYEFFGNLIIGAVIAMGAVLGYIGCNKLADGLIGSYESAYSGFSNMDEWLKNAQAFYHAWVTLFGVTIQRGQQMLSVEGVINLLRVIVCVILLVGPIVLLFNYKNIKQRKIRILLLFHWCMTALIMMGYLLGLLASANWRLSPILCSSTILTVACVKFLCERVDTRRFAAIFIVPILLVGSVTAESLAKLPRDYRQDEGLHAVAADLKALGLEYGYATFWHANAITLISDSEVKVRSVTFSDLACYRYEYQTQRSWYDDQPGVKNYFVLMDASEYQNAVNNSNILFGGDPNGPSVPSIYEISDKYYVLVYDANIF